MDWFWSLVWCFLLLTGFLPPYSSATGCAGPPVLCCPGRSGSCNRGCFCDEACVESGDCCPDYSSTCGQSSTVSPTLSSVSTKPTTTIVRLKVNFQCRSEVQEQAILEISSFLQGVFQESCKGCAVKVKPV
ncbi:somatomedin-B and thrombospondin type-1 domain-containing protein-like [Simochromis diagramma]|uniref:somatomedin-B and thrombospondin type-1 domain-containing protein-like n=1 Tax=Simochromis diagramma TaxID=43689 RepID=UPI001A7EE7BB|nr:somatomedin-B and thrombospondin type-1 domain-containing protein-like [Simochromis diagramma]